MHEKYDIKNFISWLDTAAVFCVYNTRHNVTSSSKKSTTAVWVLHRKIKTVHK